MAFDTQRAARRLTDAGLDERAAEGVADVVESATHGLATEASLLELRADLTGQMLELRADLMGQMLELRADLMGQMHGLRADVTGEVQALRAEMYRALWIQGAGIIAATAAIVGIATALD